MTDARFVLTSLMGMIILGCSEPPSEVIASEVGECCEGHAECLSGLCLTELEEAVCGLPCQDEDQCPLTESCSFALVASLDSGPGADGADGGIAALDVVTACQPSVATGLSFWSLCQSDEECLTGICHLGHCREACTECGVDAACTEVIVERNGQEISMSLCELDYAAPATVVGPIEAGLEGSEEIRIEIPSGLTSFMVILEQDHPAENVRIGFTSIVAPDGTVLIDNEDEVQDLNQASILYPGVSSVLVPATDDSAAFPQAGTYRLRVGAFETDYIDFYPIEGQIDRISVIHLGRRDVWRARSYR